MISVAVKMPQMQVPYTRLLEPSAKIMADKGISFGRLLIPLETDPLDKIYVPLVNFSKKKQCVPKDMVLGIVVPITTPVVDIENTVSMVKDSDFHSAVNKDLPGKDRAAVRALLERYYQCFALSTHDLGCSNMVQHQIHTGTHPPVHQTPYPSAYKQRQLIQGQVGEMLDDDVIEPFTSPWAAPVVLVKKHDGT